MKLTHKSCEAAKPKEKPYKLSDGGGLYLEIMPNGSKCWRMKYRILEKEKRLALGVQIKPIELFFTFWGLINLRSLQKNL